MPGFAFGLQLLFDDDLRANAGVVGAHLPQRVVAAHPVVADQEVDQRVLKCVPHVQRTRDVGRRQRDAVGGCIRLARGCEIPARFPQRVPPGLNGVGIEALGKFHEECEK